MRARAEERKEIRRDAPAGHAFGFAGAGERGVEGGDGGEIGGGLVGAFEVEQIGDGKKCAVTVGSGGPDPRERGLVAERERTEDDGVGDGVDGGGGGEAESDGENRDEGEAGGASERAEGVAEISWAPGTSSLRIGWYLCCWNAAGMPQTTSARVAATKASKIRSVLYGH